MDIYLSISNLNFHIAIDLRVDFNLSNYHNQISFYIWGIKFRVLCQVFERPSLAHIYMFKLNNRNTRKKCEICSKLTIKTPEWIHWLRSGVFVLNFEYVSFIFLLFIFPTTDFEKVNVILVIRSITYFHTFKMA